MPVPFLSIVVPAKVVPYSVPSGPSADTERIGATSPPRPEFVQLTVNLPPAARLRKTVPYPLPSPPASVVP